MNTKYRFCNSLTTLFRSAGLIVLVSLLMEGTLLPVQGKTNVPKPVAPTRITFRPGTISTQVRGRLNRAGHAYYVIKVDKGDHLIVNIVGLGGLNTEGT